MAVMSSVRRTQEAATGVSLPRPNVVAAAILLSATAAGGAVATRAIGWAAQTALRDIIGRTSLADLLRGRERIETELQKLIDERSNPWGVTVSSVEMRDIVIPGALQDAMSREAQAAREKQARIIVGQAEMEIAASFQEAAKSYHDNHGAASSRHEHVV